ncbi:hypothetical protein [Chromatium okenii]|jgi:hypothetical protein|uniref:hypothetical protein n=1 Tax=Chromatium okenii TaxID=61644 RepID=UPI0026F076F5|nr:hypothetical protein [Chromatium okenii]MBV5310904.1 hypothetical protein [Chromatium okenii]
MIVMNTARVLESSALPEATAAKIEMNAMAIQILSSNIYTNKPLAIIRELSANALDSHVAAGNPAPFDIQIPTHLKTDFIIRDYGTGLSNEDVHDLYMTYFSSTKRNTNDLIGGFGLGSKTPLAYTDRFMVHSYFNGTKTTFMVHINEEGMPVITTMIAVATKEHNGLEIVVAVKSADVFDFRNAAHKVLAYFDPAVYNVHGIEIEPVSYLVRTPHFGIRADKDTRLTSMQLVMGTMAYAIDYEHLQGPLKYYTMIDVFAPIGHLSVQASREALSYDELTKKRLAQLLEQVANALEPTMQEYLNSRSLVPFDQYLHLYAHGLTGSFGDLIPDTRLHDNNIKFSFLSRHRERLSSVAAFTFSGISSYCSNAIFIHLRPKQRISIAKVLYANPELLNNGLEVYTVECEEQYLDKLKKLVGGRIIALDDLEVAKRLPTDKVQQSSRNKSALISIQGQANGYVVFRKSAITSVSDLAPFSPHDTVYVELHNNSPIDMIDSKILFNYEHYQYDWLLSKDIAILGVPRTISKELRNKITSEYKTLSQLVQERWEAKLQSSSFHRLLGRIGAFATYEEYQRTLPWLWINQSNIEGKSFPLIRRLQRLRDFAYSITTLHPRIIKLCELQEYTIPNDSTSSLAHRLTLQVQENYPLLFVMSNAFHHTPQTMNAITHYVHVVSQEKI